MHCNNNVQGSKETGKFIYREKIEISHESYSRNAKYLTYDNPRIEILVVMFTPHRQRTVKDFHVSNKTSRGGNKIHLAEAL